MSTNTTTIPSISPELLLQRGRFRYPELDAGLIAQLAEEAAAAADERRFGDMRRKLLAGHVKLALLASERLAVEDRRVLLTAPPRVGGAVPADLALAEHLHVSLDEEELLVAALRRARKIPSRVVARALNLSGDELRELERGGMEKAAELTLSYHETMICEPAALSEADQSMLRLRAVQAHLDYCRPCNSEFWERVDLVLAHAGTMLAPLPDVALDPRHRSHRSLGGVRAPWFTRRPRALAG